MIELCVQKVLNWYLLIFIIFKAKGNLTFGMYDVQSCLTKPKQSKEYIYIYIYAKDMRIKHDSNSKRVERFKTHPSNPTL